MVRMNGPEALRLGDTIELPWTVDLPSPRGDRMSDHFSIQQCETLCSAIERARNSQDRSRCRLTDIHGNIWIAEIYHDRTHGLGGHVQWFRYRR